MHFESDISACFNSFAKVKFKISELVNSGGGIAIFWLIHLVTPFWNGIYVVKNEFKFAFCYVLVLWSAHLQLICEGNNSKIILQCLSPFLFGGSNDIYLMELHAMAQFWFPFLQ